MCVLSKTNNTTTINNTIENLDKRIDTIRAKTNRLI